MILPDDLRHFVANERWTFAKTMPEWPHEYLVRDRVDAELFFRLVEHMRAHGYEGRFFRRKITYYDEAGLVYWTMGAPIAETTIINRCRKEATFEYRLAHGLLPASRGAETEPLAFADCSTRGGCAYAESAILRQRPVEL